MGADRVLIAGGGIGGLVTALTLEQIGVECVVFESAREMKPLGVGINLQPNAVRELYALGFTPESLASVGVPIREWALVGLNGRDIYAEPRGQDAGCNWPQVAVHRGKFHMLLRDALVARAGPSALRTGHRALGYELSGSGVALLIETAEGETLREEGRLLIGADGIHSAIRAQMHPDQPPIHWGGAIMWRGTTLARPVRGGSFIGLGSHRLRMVIYPISQPDPTTGLAEINWIAERVVDPSGGWQGTGWFREVPVTDFAHQFERFRYDWLDVPAMLEAANVAYENPMIDRDPIPTWVDGPVALMGDAAHAMYPTGSNGASQAIIDARELGAAMLARGVSPAAFEAYDQKLCAPVSELILRNREAGPFGLLDIVDQRCGGVFDDIDAVIPPEERAAFMAGYKRAAGYATEALNAAPEIIEKGVRIG